MITSKYRAFLDGVCDPHENDAAFQEQAAQVIPDLKKGLDQDYRAFLARLLFLPFEAWRRPFKLSKTFEPQTAFRGEGNKNLWQLMSWANTVLHSRARFLAPDLEALAQAHTLVLMARQSEDEGIAASTLEKAFIDLFPNQKGLISWTLFDLEENQMVLKANKPLGFGQLLHLLVQSHQVCESPIPEGWQHHEVNLWGPGSVLIHLGIDLNPNLGEAAQDLALATCNQLVEQIFQALCALNPLVPTIYASLFSPPVKAEYRTFCLVEKSNRARLRLALFEGSSVEDPTCRGRYFEMNRAMIRNKLSALRHFWGFTNDVTQNAYDAQVSHFNAGWGPITWTPEFKLHWPNQDMRLER